MTNYTYINILMKFEFFYATVVPIRLKTIFLVLFYIRPRELELFKKIALNNIMTLYRYKRRVTNRI